ncbi:retron-type reverse transcriptase [Bradyrhizobium sp. USDA 4518]
MESHVVRDLLSTSGARRLHSKEDGRRKDFSLPTIGDRIAQMVIKQMTEPELESNFLQDACGYRPRKSALDAVGVIRQQCWKYDWALEFDINGLFDNFSHDLLLKAPPETRAMQIGAALHRKVADDVV